MNIHEVALPEVYKESADFRVFTQWFELALTAIQYDIENLPDLLDPLRCKAELLWLLADSMGFKYDDRLPTAFNRLVLIYFMSMIRLRGSKDGVTLAAEVNLAQFNLQKYGEENPILYNRLEDTSVPANSVFVSPHVEEGYIDLVYFAEERPIDACIEYVRPLGMYLFEHAGVRMDAKNKISVDARLTNYADMHVSIGPTRVGHYSREDYARLQKSAPEDVQGWRKDGKTYQKKVEGGEYYHDVSKVNPLHTRQYGWYRNSDAEGVQDDLINPGYRALYSLQISNNEHITQSLLPSLTDPDRTVEEGQDRVFSLGFGPQDVEVEYPDDYLKPPYKDKPAYNLRYNRKVEIDAMSEEGPGPDVTTIDDARSKNILSPRPAVNPIMTTMGDAMSINPENTKYIHGKKLKDVVDGELE